MVALDHLFKGSADRENTPAAGILGGCGWQGAGGADRDTGGNEGTPDPVRRVPHRTARSSSEAPAR